GFSDFSIASANQGLRGIPPRYNKTSISNKDAKIKLEGVPEIVQSGEEFTVEVWANNVSDLFAYIYEVRFDAGKLEFVDEGVSEGDMLPSRPGETQTFFFTKQREKGTLVASAISGRSDDVVSGNGVIARMTFRALTGEDTPDIQLHNVRLANSNSDVDRMGDVALLPDEFGLADNYPNPFNPVTRIRFQLPMASHVTLKIYNILGQEVATLVNRDMTAGFKYIRWNGTNNFGKRVASGVYIYRIEAGNFKMSKKMTLIK
ncbi:MAG: T9SS type A sorting domain-containing protein, partial [bacterium]|nr:T9SS type A sorting domain-containing protein [bacterium]